MYSSCQWKLYLGQSHLQNPKISIPKEGHVLSWKQNRNWNGRRPPLHIRRPAQLQAPRAAPSVQEALMAGDRGPGWGAGTRQVSVLQ